MFLPWIAATVAARFGLGDAAARVASMIIAALLGAALLSVAALGTFHAGHAVGDANARAELSVQIVAQATQIASFETAARQRARDDADAKRTAGENAEALRTNALQLSDLRTELDVYRKQNNAKQKGKSNARTCGPAVPAFVIERVRNLK